MITALGILIVCSDLTLVAAVAHSVPAVTAKTQLRRDQPPSSARWQMAEPPQASREQARPPQSDTRPDATDLDATLAAGLTSLAANTGLPPEALLPNESQRRSGRAAGDLGAPEAQALLEAYREGATAAAAALKDAYREQMREP